MKKISLIIVLSLTVGIFSANSQVMPQNAEFGPFIGTSYYMGEVNPELPFYMSSFAIGGVYRHNVTDRWTVRVEGTYAKLRGDDSKSNNSYQQQRASMKYSKPFSYNIGDIGLLAEFNFMPYDRYLVTRSYYTPYFLIGGSFVVIPEPKYPFEFAIPFGLGFKYAATKKLSVGVEWTYRYTFSDYLDRIDQDNFVNPETGVYKQRSYNIHRDLYSFAGIVLTYEIFRGAKPCPSYGF